MRRLSLAWAFALVAISCPAFGCETSVINTSLEKLQSLFAQMRDEGHFNVSGPLAWDFYFLDPDQNKLAAFAQKLQAQGFRVIGIGPGQGTFQLTVERFEVQTPESLLQLSKDMGVLALKDCVAHYDGFDAGPNPSP
ncbi:MAG TPA: ribonuclease E inhibitor RraB [Candidatus Cybelea sp.]|nr:ribonuclease E inhibitor RraB [Candidatus Cybelea sp.]